MTRKKRYQPTPEQQDKRGREDGERAVGGEEEGRGGERKLHGKGKESNEICGSLRSMKGLALPMKRLGCKQ
jgi:hypothetical protein